MIDDTLSRLEETALRIFRMFCQQENMDQLGDDKAKRYMDKSYKLAAMFLQNENNVALPGFAKRTDV